MNTLYYGDNLDILRRYSPDETMDLLYLDPPFNSRATPISLSDVFPFDELHHIEPYCM